MDSNDARRSKVPAGTFRSSNRPPAPTDDAAVAPAGAPPPPPPPVATSARPPKPPIPAGATPTRRVGTPSAAPPKLAPPADVGGKAKFTNTLVGVTPSKAPPPPVSGAAQVLAPPPWRGASAYQGGEEPKPRVSSISSPGVTPSVLADGTVAHPDDRRVPHTRITAAAPPAPPQGAAKPAQSTPEIGDAIQQLLDSQTSVSMEGVQEGAPVPSDTLRGQHDVPSGTLRGQPTDELLRGVVEPVRESQIEVLRDSALEEVEPVRSLPPAAPVAKRSNVDQTQRTLVEPSAVPEPRPAPPSARWSAATPVARGNVKAPEPAMSDRELAAYSFVEREESGAPAAPIEADQKATVEVDAPDLRMGIWVAAAIALVGIGGWFVTRGGFDIPPRTKTAAPQIAAPPPAAPVVDAPAAPAAVAPLGEVGPVPSTAPGQAAPAAAPVAPAQLEPAAEKPEAPAQLRPPVDARSPRASKPELVQGAAIEAPAAAGPVLKVTPSATEAPTAAAAPAPAEPTGPLPETPTRENVQSALDTKRAEVLQCAAGQHGVAEVDLTVSSTGAVTHAIVAGDFAGTPAGSCIARVVRTARFAPFSKPRFRVIYPFSL